MHKVTGIALATALLLANMNVLSEPSNRFRVVLLGTGNPVPRMDRFGPSILVDAGPEHLLFDGGRGATQRLRQVGERAERLFLTHLHSDHVVGIPDLWLTGWTVRPSRSVPFVVRGPIGTTAMMNHLRQAFEFDIVTRIKDEKLPELGAQIDAKDIVEGIVYDANGVRISAFDVDHGELITPALGYRVDYEGHSVVLSGDTRFSENLIRHAAGTDLLIHEVAAMHGQTQATSPVLAHHTTPEQAGDLFTKVHPKLAVYSHLTGDFTDQEFLDATRTTYKGPLMVGVDLIAFDIADAIGVHHIQ